MPHSPAFQLFADALCTVHGSALPFRIFWAKAPWPTTRAQWWHLSVTGMLMHAGYLGGVRAAVTGGTGLVGLDRGSAAVLHSHVVVATGPAQPSGRTCLARHITSAVAGLGLGFAGIVDGGCASSPRAAAMDHVNAINLRWAVLALLCITAGTLYQKRYVQPCDVRSANTVQLLAAAACNFALGLV
jgi:hypothetical protein